MKFPEKPKIRPLEIDSVYGGYRISVGCRMFFYSDVASLLADLSEYLYDPERITRQFNIQNPEKCEDACGPSTHAVNRIDRRVKDQKVRVERRNDA